MRNSAYILIFISMLLSFGECKSPQGAAKGKSKNGLSDADQRALTTNFFDAVREKQLANFEVALRKFEKCTEIDPKNHASLYEMATIYFHLGEDEKAYDYINQAVELDSKNEYYRLLLADLHSESGKHAEAAKIYKSLIDDFPKKIEYYYEWASALLYNGKYEEATKVYDQLEEVVGITEEISIQKQKIYLNLDKVDEAVEEIQKLIDTFPNESRYYGMLADIYNNYGMEEKSSELYQKMAEINPNDPMLQLSLADYYRGKGEMEKSFEQVKKAFANEELDIDSKINILLNYYAASEMDIKLTNQAFELLDILTEVHPDEAKAHAMTADFMYREGRLEKARKSFKKAIELDPSRFLVWSQLLITEFELGNFDSLLVESEEALELFPNQPQVYLLNGLAKRQLEQYEEAIEVLESGLIFAREPHFKIQMLTNIGDLHNELGNHKESDKAFDKVLNLDPKNALVMNNYAYYLSLRKDQLEKAAEMSAKSLDIAPDNPSYQDTYGWILYQQRKYEEAEKWIKKAMENSPQPSGEVLEHYADTLFQLGKTDQAVEYWQKAQEAGGGSKLLEKKLNDKKLYE